jgi:protein kinase C substrate 80K-H
VAERERQVAETKAALENAEAQSRDDLERKKSSPLYKALEEHREAVKRVRDQLRATQDDLGTVLGILDELAKGYNPNGQDMAVKAAVVGYRELIGDVEAEGEGDKPEAKLHTVRAPDEHLSGFDVERVINVDLESLLVDEGDDDDGGLLYRLEEYIPDSLYEYYFSAREAFIGALTSMGVLKKNVIAHDGPRESPQIFKLTADVSAARERHNAAERELNSVRSAISSAEETLEQIGNKHWFGPDGEWKKLDGTCVDTVAGDYTYELCFFGKATQQSNKDHSSNNLGHFVEWNPAAKPGEYAYYTKMAYRNGAKCWNGPMRSVNVELECGKENALLAITEPEKCEYSFKMTSPALCWPLEEAGKPAAKEAAADAVKDEL